MRRRRSDGRHDIETVFAFCTDGDRLTATLADDLSLTVTGPFAAMLDDGPANLVHRAASALAAEARVGNGVRLTLDKRLPVASGIGGGSADAAAALRLLTGLWGVDPSIAQAIAAFTEFGAYVNKAETEWGRLVPGLAADIAVFSRNMLDASPDEILNDTRCDLTILGGNIVFDRHGETA